MKADVYVELAMLRHHVDQLRQWWQDAEAKAVAATDSH